MQRYLSVFLSVITLLTGCGSPPLVHAATNIVQAISSTGAITTTSGLASCRTKAGTVTCRVTSTLDASFSNISSASVPGGVWGASSPVLEVVGGGTIGNTTRLDLTGAKVVFPDNAQVFNGAGTVVGLEEAWPELFGTGLSAMLAAFNAASNGNIILAGGDYAIDNSAGYLTATNFAGVLEFRSNARLVFTTNTKGGLKFSGGTGAVIRNANIVYSVAPSVRQDDQYALFFSATTDTIVENPYITSSPSAGVLFDQCVRPTIKDVTIATSLADGVHFANCQDGKAIGVTTLDTGDDGLAFVNYASSANYTGGIATNVLVRNSKSRGISVVGQSDVTITGFEVDGTSSVGIYTAYESAYGTRVPANVKWSAGLVKNAGTVSPLSGNQFGAEFSGVTSVSYDDVKIVGGSSRGMSGIASSGVVEIKDVTIDGAGANGAELTAANLIINNLVAKSTAGTGINIINSGNVMAGALRAYNTSTSGGLNRAISFENNTRILVDGITIIDDQVTPTGYVLGVYGAAQRGILNNYHALIPNGTFTYQSSSYPNTVLGVGYKGDTAGIVTAGTLGFYTGSGSPEGVVTAGIGSLYANYSGAAGTVFYVKESGTGNTGWVAK